MSLFICPLCRQDFADNGKTLICPNGHSFDKSKRGYVNLLTDNKSKQHGDDKLMCRARHDFLCKEYYLPLLDSIVTEIQKYIKYGDVILDAGCGEGWYTKNIINQLQNVNAKVIAVDISKDALAIANLRDTAVASVYDLPLKDKSVSIVLNIFSPFSDSEYKRVLADDGILIYVIPLEYHLYDLKALLYDAPYTNEVKPYNLDGYTLINTADVKYRIEIDNNTDIQNLFAMTPYYYTTGKTGHDIVSNISQLSVQIEFCVLTYRIEDLT